MAYIDPYTGQEVLTPEEEELKRRRAQEIADTAVQTEERKVYGDGTQEIITTREIPPEVSAPVNPNQIEAQPVAQPVPQPKPQFDRNSYNTNIAKQESGARPDIGYHDRTKSTAFGLYGITAPAYQDARRRDPSLPEDITKATPEQQTRAQNILTDNNARFLQQRGVEATPGVLSAAHFVGANGLHKFLTQKDEQGRPYISPQAQAANGGYDRARAIIEGRLNGQAVPASGALQQPAPQPQVQAQPAPQVQAQPQSQYSLAQGQGNQGLRMPGQPMAQPVQQSQGAIERYQAAQDDPISLIQLRSDTSQPAYIRQRAGLRVAEMITNENNKAAAEAALPALSQSELARVATKKSQGNSVGDWMQYLLFKHVGLNDLANQKGEQLGIGHQWTRSNILDASGAMLPVEIQTSASGKLLQGNLLDGTPLTKAQLNQIGLGLGKGASVSAEVYVDTKTNARYRSGVDSQGNAMLINIQGGKPFRGDPKDLVVQSIGTAAQKAENAAAIGLRYAGPMSFNKASASEAGKFSQENGVRIGYATDSPGAPLMDMNTGKQLVPDANGNITITKNGGGTISVATGQVPTQAAPQAAPTAAAQTPEQQYGPPAPKFRERGFENESPAAFTARQKAWQDTYKKQYEDNQKNIKTAKELLPDVAKMKKLIDQSTGSGIGAIADAAGNFFGYSTAGATAIAAIAPLASKVLMGVERFEGPQSDFDVKSYKEAAGRLADPTVPPAQKQAAFNTILEIMRRRAPDLDWDKALAMGTSTEGTTASGNKFKKVQ